MKILLGLGNPGDRYRKNRHNVGFMLLDYYVKKNNLQFKSYKNYECCQHKGIMLIKPMTYMNLSGRALIPYLQKNIVDELMVICDDIYLNLGEFRMRAQGGSGGHNGIKSVTTEYGKQEFYRMKIGVGQQVSTELSDYVLSNFSKEEMTLLTKTFAMGATLIDTYAAGDYQAMLDYFSTQKISYSEVLNGNRITDQRRKCD